MSKKFSLYVLGLPHTETNANYLTCAYSMKVVKFCKMMKRRGHWVTLYSGANNEAECNEHVECITADERQAFFGDNDPNDLDRGGFDWEPTRPYWRLFAGRAIAHLAAHAQPGGFLCMTTSWPQKMIADMTPELKAVEAGVGYEGITDLPCAFESYAWMHHVYGLRGIRNGRPQDAVIPNYFDPDDFPHLNDGDGEYLLYVGRVTPRKGLQMAIDIARAAGMTLKVAGPAAGKPQDVFVLPPDVDYVGPVNKADRAFLMAGAKALLCPTTYIEPFGGVSIEAMMCGTPVIATDWGAFTETIDSECGRCVRSVAEAVNIIKSDDWHYPALDIHDYAATRFGLDRVAPLYEKWFERLES